MCSNLPSPISEEGKEYGPLKCVNWFDLPNSSSSSMRTSHFQCSSRKAHHCCYHMHSSWPCLLSCCLSGCNGKAAHSFSLAHQIQLPDGPSDSGREVMLSCSQLKRVGKAIEVYSGTHLGLLGGRKVLKLFFVSHVLQDLTSLEGEKGW